MKSFIKIALIAIFSIAPITVNTAPNMTQERILPLILFADLNKVLSESIEWIQSAQAMAKISEKYNQWALKNCPRINSLSNLINRDPLAEKEYQNLIKIQSDLTDKQMHALNANTNFHREFHKKIQALCRSIALERKSIAVLNASIYSFSSSIIGSQSADCLFIDSSVDITYDLINRINQQYLCK